MVLHERVAGGVKRVSAETAKGLACAAYAALFFAPHGVNHAIQESSVDTQVIDIPARLSFYPDGSNLNLLNQGNIYADIDRHGIGLGVDITGLPRVRSVTDVEDLISPERLDVYTSIADTPAQAALPYVDQIIDTAKQETIDYLAPRAALGGAALYMGLAYRRSRQRIRELERTSPRLSPLGTTALAGIAAIGLAGSYGVADHNVSSWRASALDHSGERTIPALDQTPLAGATIDNPLLYDAINTGSRYADTLKSRRVARRESYLDSVVPELQRQINELDDLRDNEQLYVLAADTHASKAGTQIISTAIASLRDRYGEPSLQNLTYLGDLTQGISIQRDSIFEQAKVLDGGSLSAVAGNHDVGTTQFMDEAGITVVDGFVDMSDGLRFYGRPDPQSTPFLERSFYADPDFTQLELGEQAYDDTSQDRVTSIGLHQPAAVAALFDIDDPRAYFSKPNEDLTDCEAPATDVRQVSAAIVSAGHWHEQFPLQLICNDDGTWTVINIQGTAGGALEAPTIDNWSDPDGTPQKAVSLRVAILNTEYDSITGMIDITINPDGTVPVISRTDIGTITGQPFEYVEPAALPNDTNPRLSR